MTRTTHRWIAAAATVLLAAPVHAGTTQEGAGQETRRADVLSVADYLDLEQVSDPQISPDGTRIVYTRRWVNKLEDRWESALWVMNADGTKNRFLVKGSNPRWSPDGTRILYLAEGEPKGTQIFVRWMDAEGATTQVTRVTETPRNPQWSPDGTRIAFAMLVPREVTWKIDLPKPPEGAKWTEGPRIVDRLHYRQDRVGFTEPGYVHLFVVPADGGTPRQLTRGEWNVGARFDGLVFDVNFDWTPDGREIVFEGLKDTPGDDIYRSSRIYAVDVRSGAVRTIVDRPGFWRAPRVSPDGRLVAFIGHDSTGDTYALDRLYVVGTDGQGFRLLTGSYDREPGEPVWTPDGREIVFAAEDRGAINVQRADLEGRVRPVTEGAQVIRLGSLARDRDRTLVAVRSDPDEPGDVVRLSLRRPGPPRRLTDVNGDLLGHKRLAEVEEIWTTSTGGARIQGWLVKPPDFDPTKRYPLVLEIHGGPFAMYNVGFNFMFQTFAANGYLVLYTNPRGSTGYGEAFSKAIDFAYPGVDVEDLLASVDAVVARGIVDTTRMYVGGCSGGGVLSSAVIGTTDRFAAAAVRCPVTNWISMAGTTDIPYFTHSFFRRPFWDDPTDWWRQSTLSRVANVKTPTLLMTGELDLRTPMAQTEEYFAALKMRGVETVLLRFREEYHGTGSKPSNYMRTLLYMMDWYRRHTRGGEAAAAGDRTGSAP